MRIEEAKRVEHKERVMDIEGDDYNDEDEDDMRRDSSLTALFLMKKNSR